MCQGVHCCRSQTHCHVTQWTRRHHMIFTCVKLSQYRDDTREDNTLSGAVLYTIHGWTKHKSDILEQYKHLHDIRIHLSVADGLLLYDNRIVIPLARQTEVLAKIHAGHLGITKCRERASSSVWWKGMCKDISQMVDSC